MESTAPAGICPPAARRWTIGLSAVRATLAEHAPLLVITAAYVLAALVVERALNLEYRLRLVFFSDFLLILSLLYLGGRAIAHGWWVKLGPDGGSIFNRTVWIEFFNEHLRLRRLLPFLLVFTLMPAFMTTFTAFKNAIPVLQPFGWDPPFMELDRLIHGGRHPWELLHPLLGRAWATVLIDKAYYLWFPIVWFTVTWQAWTGREALRTQFLVSFMLCWIVLGTVLATILSSAGPCYYSGVTSGPDPYLPLMDYLRQVDTEVPLRALWVQNYLWEGYAGLADHHIEGISAMPSLHVSMAMLLFLLGRRVGRVTGWLYGAFLALTLVGSVHLGWHYAIDGYVAIALTIVIWVLSGRFARWYRSRTAPARSAAP